MADGVESRSYAKLNLEGSSTEVGLGTITSDQTRVAPLLEGGGIGNSPIYWLIGPIILRKDLNEADEAAGWMWYEPSYGCIGREKQRAYTAHTYKNKDSYSPCILLHQHSPW